MKALLFASALALGGTAVAQDMTTAPAPQTSPPVSTPAPADPGSPDTTMQTPPAAPTDTTTTQTPAPAPGSGTMTTQGDTMGAPATGTMAPPAGDTGTMTPPSGGTGTMSAGGYMPSTPALSGQPTPGARVVFQQAPSPSQAYPAPAPLQSYPICKKGQTDKCRQRGG